MTTSRQVGGANSPRKLVSWKEIADHYGCDVRTARRWERERGLPVHRAPGNKRSGVFAYTSELDCWERSRAPEPQHPGQALANPSAGELQDKVSAAVDRSGLMGGRPVPSAGLRSAVRLALHRWPTWVSVSLSTLVVAAAALTVVKEQGSAPLHFRPANTALSPSRHLPALGAEDLYLRGRYFWNLRTGNSLAKAQDLYTQAIVKDPAYAEAFAGLAETYDLLPQFGQADLGDSLTKAKAAADRAIALNPNLAAAHTAKAFAMFFWDWDIAGSDAEFRRALALDPNAAQTHQWYASTLQCRNEGAECMRQIDEAHRLNPTSAAIATDAAYFQAEFGDFNAGMKALKEIEQTQPTLATPAQFLAQLDFATGDFPGYIEEARRFAAITHRPEDAALAEAVARGWAKGGKIGLLEAKAKVLQIAFDQSPDTGYVAGYDLGQTLLLLGHAESALPYFRAALKLHHPGLTTMQDCPWAKPLLSDPGYAALFAEIRERLHGGYPAHREPVRTSLRLPR